MLKRTHKAFGLALAGGLIVAQEKTGYAVVPTGLVETPLLLFLTHLSATWPDIDERLKQKKHPFLAKLVGHRKLTHAIWIPLMWLWIGWFSGVNSYWLQVILSGVVIGWTSHLIGDGCSVAGVDFLYPLIGYHTSRNGQQIVNRPRLLPALYTVGKSKLPWPVMWYSIALGLITYYLYLVAY